MIRLDMEAVNSIGKMALLECLFSVSVQQPSITQTQVMTVDT